MGEPSLSEFTQIGTVSKDIFGSANQSVSLNPNTYITCELKGNKLIYYKSKKMHHKLNHDINKLISYQYKLEIYSAIYSKIIQIETKFRSSAQTLTELMEKKQENINSEIRNYLIKYEEGEISKKEMNDADNKITFQKFLDDVANNLLLLLFDKSIRMWNLKMVESYERFRVQKKVEADKNTEGSRRILDILNVQNSVLSNNYGPVLMQKLEAHSKFILEMKEIITVNENFTSFDNIGTLDDQNVNVYSLKMLQFFENFINNVLDTKLRIQEFEFQNRLIENELGIWEARNEFSQEEAACPYLNAAIKYLSKKLWKVDHRLAVYDTVSRLERLDVCVNEGNKSISTLTSAVGSITMTGNAHLHNDSRTHYGTPNFTYYVSSIEENYRINKARVDLSLSDPTPQKKNKNQIDNEKEKEGIVRDLNESIERSKNFYVAEHKLREALKKDDDDRKNFDINLNKAKSKFEKYHPSLLNFSEEHQSTELSLKKDLIPTWVCMLTKYLNITKSRLFTKFDKHDFLATNLHPQKMIDILYQILLDNQKIRQKKFRLFGSDEFIKVFNCGVISIDIIIEFLTHPRIYGCFKDNKTLSGQTFEGHLRSENCNENLIKCIKDSISIIIIGEQLEFNINKKLAHSRIKKIQNDGIIILNQNGYKRFADKVEGYFMKLQKEKSINLD